MGYVGRSIPAPQRRGGSELRYQPGSIARAYPCRDQFGTPRMSLRRQEWGEGWNRIPPRLGERHSPFIRPRPWLRRVECRQYPTIGRLTGCQESVYSSFCK